MEGYYSKLLEVGGVEDPGMRYRVVYPENFNRLSPHLSLSAMLLYSPAAMKRIRAFVLGRPAYIVPGRAFLECCPQLNSSTMTQQVKL